MPHLGYRADIEGLRSVCIFGVVAYHAGFAEFSGGFVGVDAFFVISGFLITGLLLKELKQDNQIALLAFWARRARRLLPNALLTLVVVLLLTIFVAPPSMKATVSNDTLAALLYLSNYFFAYRTVDYFDENVTSSPILHFWSLSVEEQFYIVWPLLIVAIVTAKARRPRQAIFIGLILLTICSFGASLFWISNSQPAAFFHTESRLWQLGAGALLAFGSQAIAGLPRRLLAPVAWLGLVALFSCIAFYDEEYVYPGLWAVLPTISTLAVLAGGNAGSLAPGVVLGTAALTWMGRLSYSIYLWHWPILIFCPLLLDMEQVDVRWYALGLILPVSAAAYYLVENPIRRGDWSGYTSVATLAVALTTSASIAAITWVVPGIVLRDMGTSQVAQMALEAKNDRSRDYSLACRDKFNEVDGGGCTFGAKDANKRLALFGDSHAAHLFPALDEAARSKGWAMVVFAKSSCPPIDVDVYNWKKKTLDSDCITWRELAVKKIIAAGPDLVVISSWTGWAQKMMRGEEGRRLAPVDARRVYIEGSMRILQKLRDAGLRVIVVRGTPKNRRGGGSDCIVAYGPLNCGTARREAIEEEAPEVEAARQVKGVEVLDLTDHFCGRNVCQAVVNGMVVYRDATHITATFARTLGPAFAEVLN